MASWKARVRGGIPGPAGSLMPMVVLVVVAVLAGGCSSGSSPGDGQTAATPTPTPAASAVCADVVALQSSLNALRQIEVTKVGSNGLKAAVQDVGAKAQALERSAGSQLGPE